VHSCFFFSRAAAPSGEVATAAQCAATPRATSAAAKPVAAAAARMRGIEFLKRKSDIFFKTFTF